jgi:hypothetical protein
MPDGPNTVGAWFGGEFSSAAARDNARHINTRGVSVRQNVFGFGTQSVLAAPVTYTLVDAEGNPLEGVSMRAVQLSTGNAPPANQNPTGHWATAGGRGVAWFRNEVITGAAPGIPTAAEANHTNFRQGSSVIFSPNGYEVTVLTGTTGDDRTPAQHLNARFAIVAK